jgi:mannose-6-phosphate isomerase-like protein (cupin superfamily)
MKTIKEISTGVNYSAVNIGSLSELSEHIYRHPAGFEVVGKVFIGEALKCTGTEISFHMMPPATGLEFLHTHKTNEELYFVIKGNGEYQVDETIFPITEGSAIRVATAGKRSWRNTDSEPMVMMVIQSKSDSLKELGINDGDRINEPLNW